MDRNKVSRIAKRLVASVSADDAGEELVNEYLQFFKRDFRFSGDGVEIVFKDTENGSPYADFSIEVTGDCENAEAFVNDIDSDFGKYFRSEVERNLGEEMGSSTFIDYENALMAEEGLDEDEADRWASEKLCTFMLESYWGNSGPNPASIYCDGEKVGTFDFFGLLKRCCTRW